MTEISREPLRTSVASEGNFHRLRPLSEAQMMLEPKHSSRTLAWWGLSLLVLAAVSYAALGAAGVQAPFPVGSALVLGALGSLCVGLALFYPLQARVVFDRDTRSIAFSGLRLGSRRGLPLDEVLAIQICGPSQRPDFEGSTWPSYQLNLALAPGASKKDRISLLDNGGLDELLFMGWKLAEFLDVPFLDHRALDESPQKDVKQ
jgi:hypothetical protein